MKLVKQQNLKQFFLALCVVAHVASAQSENPCFKGCKLQGNGIHLNHEGTVNTANSGIYNLECGVEHKRRNPPIKFKHNGITTKRHFFPYEVDNIEVACGVITEVIVSGKTKKRRCSGQKQFQHKYSITAGNCADLAADVQQPGLTSSVANTQLANDSQGYECEAYAPDTNDYYLRNTGMNQLNTADENASDPNLDAKYDPLEDAFCFNKDYPNPVPYFPVYNRESHTKQYRRDMYNRYKKAFDEGLADFSSTSEENNGVTNNRIPGMFLRMCFHDNTIDTNQPKFQDYVKSKIAPDGKWTGPFQFLPTSGGDASHLICKAERLHPNNNYDNTATRVLNSIQEYLKPVYPEISYADLLHNGCKAATLYLTGNSKKEAEYYFNLRNYEDEFLRRDPFTFGRKDACHVDLKCGKRYPLCGGSELLPGLRFTAQQLNNWFVHRGMNECLWMSTMWTHTTMDNMASMCPIKKLTCTAGHDEVLEFDRKTIETNNEDKRYFVAGDELDYFNFFLEPGTHTAEHTSDPEEPSCDWKVPFGYSKRKNPWPLTAVDCTLGLDNVKNNGLDVLANAITNFHTPGYNTADILGCALGMLSGSGYKEHGICDSIYEESCQSPNEHMFGSFFSDFTSTNGIRRHRALSSSSQDMASHTQNCTGLDYDMHLMFEDTYLVGLAVPREGDHDCPAVMFQSIVAEDTNEHQKDFSILRVWENDGIDEESKIYVGTRPLEAILEAFESADVNLNGQKFYDPVTNNCASFLRNMAELLGVEVDDRVVNFIVRNLMKESSEHVFETIRGSPAFGVLYPEGNRFLKGVNNEDVIAKLIKYYA